MSHKATLTTSLIRWIILISLASSAVILGLFVLLYAQTGAWQMLVIAGLAMLCIACLVVAAWLVRRGQRPELAEGKPEAAGYLVLLTALVAYGGSELVLAGATWHLTVGGVLVILLLGSVILSRKWGVWLATAGLFGTYVWLVNRFEPLPRYDLTQSAVLHLYIIPTTTALLVLLIIWRLLRAYRYIETIRSRLLIVFVLIVLLPAAIITALSGVLGWQSGQQQVINQLESVATLKEAEIEAWVNGLQTNLVLALHEHQRLSMEVLLQESVTATDYQAAYDELQEHFALIIEETQLFEEVFLMNRQGQVVLSTDAEQEGKVLSSQVYFWEGLEEAHVHPPFYSPSLGRMSVVAVHPVVDLQGHTLGVLAGRASMATLSEIMLKRAGLGETGETYLVGSNHVMLTGSRFVAPGEEVGTYVRTEGVNAALEAHVNGSGLYDDYRDVPVVGVYRWLPELQVALLAEQDQAEAFRLTYVTLGINAGVATIAVLVAIVSALFITRGIATPLANLAETAARIAAGDLEVTAAVGRKDEIGTLAQVFNSMTDRLRELISRLEQRVVELERTQEALRESEESYRELADSITDIFFAMDQDMRFTYWNKASESLMGIRAEDALGKSLLEVFPDTPWVRRAEKVYRDVLRTRQPQTFVSDTDTDLVGRHYVLEISAYPSRSGISVFVKDITERKWAEEALGRRAAQLAALNRIGHQVASILDQQELLQQSVDAVREDLAYLQAAVLLMDEEASELYVAAATDNFWEIIPDGYRQPVGKGAIGTAAQTGKTVLVKDASSDTRVYRVGEWFSPSSLSMPIKIGKRVIGVLEVEADVPNAFDEDDRAALETMADQIAIAIENARLYADIEQRRMYLEGVLGAAPDAIVTLDARHRIVEWNPGAEKLFGYSPEEAIGQNIDDLITDPDVLEEAVGFTQRVTSGGKVPPTETVRYRKDGSPVDVIVAGSPILVGDELIGVVAVYTDITERVRMEETLRALALLDELTNLYNRRGFSVLAEQQLKMAERGKRKMLLLFADLDGLKWINDTFGHSEGDQALIEIADVLEETFRESDIVARIGGDEFVVLAIETDGTPAEVLTTRLQENLAARNAEADRRYELSLSVGLAHYDPESPCSIEELLTQADRAMYEQKRG